MQLTVEISAANRSSLVAAASLEEHNSFMNDNNIFIEAINVKRKNIM